MGQLTIRGIAPDIEDKIRKIAKNNGKSINSVIQEIIHQHSEFSRKRKTAPSEALRELAGGWSEKEASDFCAQIQSFEQIDKEMWK